MYGFHAKEGWFFERTEDGGVRIVKTGPKDGDPVIAQVQIDPGTWASIVASVSTYGDDAEHWKQALDFHNGDDELGKARAEIERLQAEGNYWHTGVLHGK